MSDYGNLENPDRFISDIAERLLEMLREFLDTRSELHRLRRMEESLNENLKILGCKFHESNRGNHLILDVIFLLENIKDGINPSICQHKGCKKEVAIVISLTDGRILMRYCPDHIKDNENER